MLLGNHESNLSSYAQVSELSLFSLFWGKAQIHMHNNYSQTCSKFHVSGGAPGCELFLNWSNDIRAFINFLSISILPIDLMFDVLGVKLIKLHSRPDKNDQLHFEYQGKSFLLRILSDGLL